MKKLVLIISLMIFSATSAFGYCDYMNRCAPYSSSNNIWTPPFIEQFAQNIIKNELKKSTGQDFDVTLHASGLANLLNGKFKSLELSGQNVVIQGFNFSSLKLKTLCPAVSVDINSRPIKARKNIVLGVWAELSAQDLISTISYGNYLSVANSGNLTKIGLASYRIYPSTINVENGKLYFSVNATPIQSYKPFDIAVGADLRVQDGNMVASKIDLINLYTGFDLTQFSDLLAAINNWCFPFSLSGSDHSEIQIQNIHMVGSKIFIDATIFIPKT